MNRVHWLILSLGIALLLQAGCGSSDAKLRNDLKATGMAYHMYHDEHRKGPANWDELITYAKDANLSPESIRRVRDANYDLKWNVKFSEVKDSMANTVLGEKSGGGPKIMMDGGVR